MVSGIDSDLVKVERHLHEGRRVVYADAEDPGFWHRLRLDGLKAVVLAMPDPEAKNIATRQLRRHGFEGVIGAISSYPEEAEAAEGGGRRHDVSGIQRGRRGFGRACLGGLGETGRPAGLSLARHQFGRSWSIGRRSQLT
jgi:glutathione-regulated potassium-efflux system ancillary protein KefC